MAVNDHPDSSDPNQHGDAEESRDTSDLATNGAADPEQDADLSPTPPEPSASPAQPIKRRLPTLSDPLRRGIMILLVLGALGGLVLTARSAVTGSDPTSDALPDAVERLIPSPESEVLKQSRVGIDVASGYDGYLVVNGTEIRTSEDGLTKDLGSGLIEFQPRTGAAIEELNPETNCVTAVIWKQSEGLRASRPISWCFAAA